MVSPKRAMEDTPVEGRVSRNGRTGTSSHFDSAGRPFPGIDGFGDGPIIPVHFGFEQEQGGDAAGHVADLACLVRAKGAA